MKTKVLVIAVLLIIVSFIAFGFINKKETKTTHVVAVNSSNIDVSLDSFGNENKKSVPTKKLNFFVRGARNRTITKSKLIKAKTLDDVIEHFPSNWIGEYVSVEVYRTTKDNETKVLGKNITLNNKQKTLLKNTNIGDDVLVRVVYKSKNSLTNDVHTNETNVKMTVVPEVSASFIGDENSLIEYLTKNRSKEILDWKFKPMQNATAFFIIDVNGNVTDVNITESTGVIPVDVSIIELLYKMPKWSPAKDSNGKNIKQHFEFVIGDSGC